MMRTNLNYKLFSRCLLPATMLVYSAFAWASDDSPAEIIQNTAGGLLEKIDLNRDVYAEDPEALQILVREDLLPLLDQEYSARLILGRHGRGLPAEKITAFGEALSTALTNRYSTGLLRFRSDNQMEILPPSPNDNDRLTRVRTRIKLENGGAAPVDYAFRKTENGWKVFDVTIEGVSYVMTFRNQLGPKVASQGIDKVTSDLLAGKIEVTES